MASCNSLWLQVGRLAQGDKQSTNQGKDTVQALSLKSVKKARYFGIDLNFPFTIIDDNHDDHAYWHEQSMISIL